MNDDSLNTKPGIGLTPQPKDRAWRMVIRPRSRWWDLHLADLWRYRDLILMFIRRDFVSQFKQTLLGPLWFVMQPLLTTLVFIVVFGNIAGLSTDGLPQVLFYLSGNVVWMYFANVLTMTSSTFISNAHLFGKVYFPRLAVPLSVSLSHLIRFGLQAVFFLAFWGYYAAKGADIRMTWAIVLLPVVVVIMAGLSLGLGVLFSSMTTKYRDLRFLLDFGVRLLMFTTPVVYPLSSLPDQWRWFLLFNPMTPLIETFRFGFMGSGTFSWWMLGYSAGFAAAALVLGVAIFNRVERTFMDTV
ncbi:MAG TPA: ABC transporter permease [Kiritimatiellia bacterium]|nr:ABC transporter permease [Kiritimatiellia bacterium]